MTDELIINGKIYPVTDDPALINIGLAQELDKLVPKESFYRDPRKPYKFDHDLAVNTLHLVAYIPLHILEDVDNLERIYMKFIHPLLFRIYNPVNCEIDTKKLKSNLYEDETILPFAEACDLLSNSNVIGIADYFLSVYYRNRREKYDEKKARKRVESMKGLSYNHFLAALTLHNEAAAKVRQYHSKLFEGKGGSRSMSALINSVAEKGVFNKGGKSPLESARDVKICEFFDYVETII